MSSCVLNFDSYQSQYYPGNVVIGRVICAFTETKNIRGIKLYLEGEEHTSWTKRESYYDSEEKKTKSKTVEYSGDHVFLHVQHDLKGPGDMGPGRFEYQFRFELPRTIPGTYNGKYGWVKYTVKAKVDRPFKFDYEDVKELCVVSPINFNEIRENLTLDPVCYSEDKTLCCWCCASGPITMNVNLDKEAFVQGETAIVLVDITNMSNENVESVQVKLGLTVKSVVKHPQHDSKSDYELLAIDNDTGVGAHGERQYEFALEIPKSSVIPNFSLCTLFRQHSTLEVTAVLEGCHSDMEISANIEMGHIPIQGEEEYQRMDIEQGAPFSPPNIPFPSGGTPTPYPAVSNNLPYPPGTNAPPYGAGSIPAPYPPAQQLPYPNAMPQPEKPMGFVASSEFPSLPASSLPHMPPPHFAPYPPSPSAPLPGNVASAPTKDELAEEGFVVLAPTKETAPPSYNDAVPYPPK